jgi:hypothetical protein
MKVTVKDFAVDMEVKNTGVELEVRDTDDTFLSDLVITKTKLIGCEGRTKRENGQAITWDQFRKYMNSRT